MTRPALFLSALVLAAAPLLAQPIPDRPDQLTFKPLAYTPPSARDYRVQLKNGLVVFVAEDRTLPLVNLSLVVRSGRWLEPADKAGLAGLTGSQIRRGGSKSLTAEALDEKLDALAAQVGSGIGDTSGTASLNCLADNLDESLRVFVEMLRFPRFQEDRLALAREQALQEMKKRNDDAADIEAREWNRLLNGPDHFTNHLATKASIDSITRADLLAFHDRYYSPSNMIAAVSGAFSRADMIRKLEAAFAGWPAVAPVPPIPPALHPAEPGLYRVAKQVNQGRFSAGLLTVKRDSPDVYALEVMNEILGGSDFTSRITKRVRSDEGLAYSAGSALSVGAFYPGRFRALFQSKSRSVAYAASLVLEEIRRMRETLPPAEEMETIKNNLVQTFPSSFGSKAQAMGVFASDEYTKRDPAYWATYRDRIRAVTPQDVQRVARTYLTPEKLVMLVVGDQKEIDLGDPKHPVTLVSLAPGGRIVNVPLPDPLTLARPAGR
jgi:zinc protease